MVVAMSALLVALRVRVRLLLCSLGCVGGGAWATLRWTRHGHSNKKQWVFFPSSGGIDFRGNKFPRGRARHLGQFVWGFHGRRPF